MPLPAGIAGGPPGLSLAAVLEAGTFTFLAISASIKRVQTDPPLHHARFPTSRSIPGLPSLRLLVDLISNHTCPFWTYPEIPI